MFEKIGYKLLGILKIIIQVALIIQWLSPIFENILIRLKGAILEQG